MFPSMHYTVFKDATGSRDGICSRSATKWLPVLPRDIGTKLTAWTPLPWLERQVTLGVQSANWLV